MGPNKPAVFDTSPALPWEHYALFLMSSAGGTAQDNWVWFTAPHDPLGVVFKYDVNAGDSAVTGGIFRPLIRHLFSQRHCGFR